VDPYDPFVLGRFRDNYISKAMEFRNRGAADAAYRNWLRDEPGFRRRRATAGGDGLLNTALGVAMSGWPK
jgi:hypothetical protein